MILKRKLRTVHEEIGFNTVFIVIFVGIWYGVVLRSILQTGFQLESILFYIAGLFVAVRTGRSVKKALYQRLKHREVMEKVQPWQGRIIDITREYWRLPGGKRDRIVSRCFLKVEVLNPNTGLLMNIVSEPYAFPPQRYLASPLVQVYMDDSGWHPVIDGFQLKRRKSEPDIPLQSASSYLKDFSKASVLSKLLVLASFTIIILQLLGVI